MTLPVSGAISFNAINVELGVAGTTTASLNQASYRALAGVPSGAISMSNFYGKSNVPNYGMFGGGVSIATTAKYVFATNSVTAGTNLNRNVYVGSSSSSTSTGYVLGGITSAITNATSKYSYGANTCVAGTNLNVETARAGSGGNSTFGLVAGGAYSGATYNSGTKKYTYSNDSVAVSTALTAGMGSNVNSCANASVGNFGGASSASSTSLVTSTYTNSSGATAAGGNRTYGTSTGSFGVCGTSAFGVIAGYSTFNTQTYVVTAYNYVQRYTYSSGSSAASTSAPVTTINSSMTSNSTVGVLSTGSLGGSTSTASYVNTFSNASWASGTALNFSEANPIGGAFGALMATLQ